MKEFYGGGTSWTQAKYETSQDNALTAVRADTTLNYSNAYTNVNASCGVAYATNCYSYNRSTRWRFALPAGKRGSITKVRLSASCAAAKLWGSSYTSWSYSDFLATDCELLLYFTESATAFASGAALLDGTPDLVISLDDINANHVAAGRTVPVVFTDAWPVVTIDADAVASALNAFGSDTIYVWSAITRPSYFPYLYGPPVGGGNENDFQCEALLTALRIAVTTT